MKQKSLIRKKRSLCIKVNHRDGNKGEYILLNRLCTSTTALVQCIYKVQELKPIRLQYHYENPMNITFIWNKVYEGQKNIKETKYEINEKQKVLIYEHGKRNSFIHGVVVYIILR